VRRLTSIVFLLAALLLGGVPLGQASNVCSQPVSENPDPILRDCIHVARSSIGLEDCAKCLCDVDGSGDIHLSDALVCLRYVIGNDVELACPECSVSTTTSTTMPGCASCNDVLTGTREYDDLCPLARFVYDDMAECPERCGSSCLCPRVPSPGNPVISECLTSDLLRCLRTCLSTCGEMTQNCSEQ
jgi:hypothetical protein